MFPIKIIKSQSVFGGLSMAAIIGASVFSISNCTINSYN